MLRPDRNGVYAPARTVPPSGNALLTARNIGDRIQTSNLLIPIAWTATEDLTEAELIALNEAAQTGRDPHSIGGYFKIGDLYAEDGGSHMHRETRVAPAAVTFSRLAQS